jgi:hypothetical protein
MEEELKPRAQSEIDLEQEVLDEAFTLMPDDPLALEKKIRSVALLLEELTKEGNEAVSGAVAYGFAEILKDAAADVARLRKVLRRLDE